MKHIGWWVSAAGAALLLSACGTTTGTSPAASTGGTVVVAEAPLSAPNWFFPVISVQATSNTNLQTVSLMYKPLLTLTNKDTVNYQRSLASSITYNKAGSVYTIHLNPKYRWSNGHPVTAKDFVFTWNIMKDSSETNAHLPWSYLGVGIGGLPTDWKSAVATGSHTVVVTLTRPVNPTWFILNGLAQINPAPASVWDRYPHNMKRELSFIQSIANSPSKSEYQVVDGPFRFQSMVPNQQWVFVPNPHYNGHRASIKKLIFQYETSTTAEFTGLKSGTVTVGYLESNMWKSKNLLTHDVVNPSTYVLGFDYIAENLSSKAPGGVGTAFQQPYVRQALEMGVNQPGIIKNVFHGYGVIEDSPIPPAPKTPFSDPALKKPLYPYNPKAGKALLMAHGWREKNGVMTKGGVQLKFTLSYMAGVPTWTNMMEIVKNGWAQEGVDVTLQPKPFATVIGQANQANAKGWQMAFWGEGWSYEPDFYPSGDGLLNSNGAANTEGYSSSTMNRLINASTNLSGNTAQTIQRLYAYQKYAAQQVPVIWVPWAPSSYVGTGLFPVHSRTIKGTISTFNQITNLYYPNRWTLTK